MAQITVVTATYNRGKYNLPSVESILEQSYQGFKYIIVNDESKDDTQEILDGIKHPNLVVIHQKNKGFTNTMVDVISEVDTPYIAIHGSGDISHRDRLKRQVDVLESDSKIGAVGCRVQRLDEHRNPLPTWNPKETKLSNIDYLLKHNFFNHGEVMMRRSAYLQAGGYRRFFKYSQDLDLWLRLASFSTLTKVDAVLYNQMMLPKRSISYDYTKVEEQAMLCAFARYLAKQRLSDGNDLLEALGEESFQTFKQNLSQDEKDFVIRRILTTARITYAQSKDEQTIVSAAQRAKALDPNSFPARNYLRVQAIRNLFKKIGLDTFSTCLGDEDFLKAIENEGIFKPIMKKIFSYSSV